MLRGERRKRWRGICRLVMSNYCRSWMNLLEGSSNVVYKWAWIVFLNIIIASEVKSFWKLKTRIWPFGGLVRLFNYLN
jgi:hypothetical protein